MSLHVQVYGWFTEGFDTRDFQEAKSLLPELGWSTHRGPIEFTSVAIVGINQDTENRPCASLPLLIRLEQRHQFFRRLLSALDQLLFVAVDRVHIEQVLFVMCSEQFLGSRGILG
jgi:hypothetical protein